MFFLPADHINTPRPRLEFLTGLESFRNIFDILDVICVDQNRVVLNCAGGFIHANRVSITDGSNDVCFTFKFFYLLFRLL